MHALVNYILNNQCKVPWNVFFTLCVCWWKVLAGHDVRVLCVWLKSTWLASQTMQNLHQHKRPKKMYILVGFFALVGQCGFWVLWIKNKWFGGIIGKNKVIFSMIFLILHERIHPVFSSLPISYLRTLAGNCKNHLKMLKKIQKLFSNLI